MPNSSLTADRRTAGRAGRRRARTLVVLAARRRAKSVTKRSSQRLDREARRRPRHRLLGAPELDDHARPCGVGHDEDALVAVLLAQRGQDVLRRSSATASSTLVRTVSTSSSVTRAYMGHLQRLSSTIAAVEHADDPVGLATDADVVGHDQEGQAALEVQPRASAR